MVIDSKITSRPVYPWFFFYRIARLTLVVFFPTLFLILFFYRSSHRAGIVHQMKMQIEHDLHLIQQTMDLHQASWQTWCKNLQPSLETYYVLVTRDQQRVCGDSTIPTSRDITADIRINDHLILRKGIIFSSLNDSMDMFDRVLFLRIVPLAILSYLIFIFLFYRQTRPLGTILSKVEKFRDDIPFKKSLELLYQKDEWASIEEALTKADQRLQKQVEEAKQQNEKNTTILEAINDAIIAVDKFESILFFNTKFQKNFIRTREGLEIQKKAWHIFSDEVLEAFRSVLKNGEVKSLKAMTFPLSRNPDRFFDLTITPLKSSDGQINGALGVFYDVTDFKLTEQMRVDFVANVSHEIRTPLTSIKGFTQILQAQSDKVDESLRPFLDKIVGNTERMISLFNDLLSLSVIESRKNLKFEKFSLIEAVEAVESNIIANYPQKEVTFERHLELETLRGDPRLLEQVILNLCDNACKYADDSVHIVISAVQEKDKAIVTVRDNGPGIAREHLSRIFERFYRIEASRESLRGTGLGLSIVKQIITKHKGKIRAESEGPGQGTAFIIELPSE